MINFYNILNSLDKTLENNSKSYSNSSIDNFIDKVKVRIESNNIKKISEYNKKDSFFILDRYEADYAICEDLSTGKVFDIPKKIIDSCAKEGDILKFDSNRLTIDYAKTIERKEFIKNLASTVFNNSK